jgi:peptide chain release factor 1
MIERLKTIETRYEEISSAIGDPAVLADQDRYRRLLIELSELQPIVDSIRQHAQWSRELEDNRALLTEPRTGNSVNSHAKR